jgi:uncharacterized protein (DUF1015 family)
MAIIRPFAALRPKEEYAQKVISPPYDVINRQEASELASDNPLSFLHICRSEIDLPHIEDPHQPEVYKQARLKLEEFISQGIFIQEKEPCLYIYQQTMDGRVQTGIAACASIDEYIKGDIKKHELTRVEKELDRIHHFDACNANTEPVFLTYRSNNEINELIEDWMLHHAPIYDFIAADSVGHKLWIIHDPDSIKRITECFRQIPALYIADGHHRSASAVKVGLKRREENPDYTGSEEFNYFMAVLFPDSDLHIYDYNRVIKDLNGMTKEEFLTKLSPLFHIETVGNEPFRPDKKHVFSMYLDGTWYRLFARENILSDHIIKGLDVSILQEHVLAPLLGIKDPRTDQRIDFVGGIRGLKELSQRVDMDMAVAFALYPVTMEDLLTVADQNEIMPPKSTWFEPKLGSGLLIHTL